MNPAEHERLKITRRQFLGQATTGIGSLALASLLNRSAWAEPEHESTTRPWEGILKRLHVPPRAKRVIHLYMAGGPSHLETFDYKPKLAEMHGQPMPESYTKGQPIAQLQGKELKCMGPHADQPAIPAGLLRRRTCTTLWLSSFFLPKKVLVARKA